MAHKVDRDDYVWMGDHHFNGKVTGISGETGGIQSITGDGVDNSDPDNPVISYPTPGDIGAATASQGELADTAVQPGDLPATPTWTTISGKPDFVAEGATAADARTAIGAGTSNLALGTTSSTAKAGDYQPTWAQVSGKPSTFAPIIGTAANEALAGNTVIPTIPSTISQAEVETGTATTQRTITAQRVRQGADAAIAASDKVSSTQEGGVGTLITNIIQVTQSQYDNLTPQSGTFYAIVG